MSSSNQDFSQGVSDARAVHKVIKRSRTSDHVVAVSPELGYTSVNSSNLEDAQACCRDETQVPVTVPDTLQVIFEQISDFKTQFKRN